MGFDEADKTDGTQPRRAHRLRAYLALLVLALVLPGLLFTGYVLHRYAEAERARLEAQVSAQAHNVAAAVDRRLGGLLEALRVLAVTSDLSDDDLAAFHRRAVEAREIVGRNIVLRAESGQQLVNARVPWGAPLPVVRLDADRRALAERRPVVSNAFRSPVTQESMVAIIAPIFEDAAQNYLLSLSIDLADASSILADVVLPDGQVAAIIDGSGVIVARSREHARFVGRKAPRTGPEGLSAVEQGVDLEGRPALIAWSRTTLADWRVASSAPLSAIDAPVRRAWGALAAIGAVTLFLSMLLVWALSRRIAGPLSALAAAGLELGARRRAPHVHTPLREANAIGEAMRIAGERLSDYEARLEKALSVARMFSFEWSVGSDVISRSESASELLGAPAADVREGSRVAFRARVQPEDVERFVAASEGLTPQAPIYRVEYRYMRPDGGIVWLESSGYGEFDDEGRLARVTGFTTDVTARKDAQTRQDLLVRELHHRVKNNLATVLAVANLSGRGATSLEDYKKRLRARIQSMARSHTLLTESAFQRASLAAVLRNELEAYADPEEGRVTLEGAEVEVSPESAIGLGMAFHELATNAGKYGALSHESGRLDVRWGVETGAGERTLRLRWIESGGPAVSRPNRLGFGTRLLENVIAGQLGGRIEMRYEPGGLEVEIVAPMGRFAAQTREPDPAGA